MKFKQMLKKSVSDIWNVTVVIFVSQTIMTHFHNSISDFLKAIPKSPVIHIKYNSRWPFACMVPICVTHIFLYLPLVSITFPWQVIYHDEHTSLSTKFTVQIYFIHWISSLSSFSSSHYSSSFSASSNLKAAWYKQLLMFSSFKTDLSIYLCVFPSIPVLYN